VVELENKEGIEASVVSGMLNYIVEGYQNGIFTEQELEFIPKRGGLQLRNLIELIVNREGIGKILAEGFSEVNKIKNGSEKYTSHIKCVGREHRLESEISNRTIGSLVNPRGGDFDLEKIPFGDGTTVGTDVSVIKQFYKDLHIDHMAANRLWNGPDGYSVGRLTKWAEDYDSVYLSLGFCHRPIILHQINLNNLKDFYTATTGLEVEAKDLLNAGERIFNLLKLINVKFGVTRIDDTPSRGFAWPVDKQIIISEKNYGALNMILDGYYNERGWDPLTSIPQKETLINLDLSEETLIAEKFTP
jgi:aldehyde:ferredoxin oxidoreductase